MGQSSHSVHVGAEGESEVEVECESDDDSLPYPPAPAVPPPPVLASPRTEVARQAAEVPDKIDAMLPAETNVREIQQLIREYELPVSPQVGGRGVDGPNQTS